MRPCRAGQEREPCGVAAVSEKQRVHNSNCTSLLKWNRSVELPRGLPKAESSTPRERRREPVKRQSHSSLFMARDNCLVVCLFSIADRVNHGLYLHSRWEFGPSCCFVSCGLKQMGSLFIIMTSIIIWFLQSPHFSLYIRNIIILLTACLQGMLGIIIIRIKAWSTWKGYIRKMCGSRVAKGNGQMCFGILQSKTGNWHPHPGPEVSTKADTTLGNMEVPCGLLMHLSQYHNLLLLCLFLLHQKSSFIS